MTATRQGARAEVASDLWDEATLDALAVPRGDAGALARILDAHLALWRTNLASSSDPALADVRPHLEQRHCDPIFMAWLLDRWRQGEKCSDLAPVENRKLPQLGGLRFVRIGVRDCPQLARMIREPERESTLSNDAIDREVGAALGLIETVWPEALVDIDLFARALLVLQMPKGHYPSGSDAGLPFILKVTVAPGMWPALLADSLVHETAHVKLRIASRLEKFCEDDEAPRFHHPWRHDPRPLAAVLLAAHAFVSIFTFYAKLASRFPNDAAARAEAERLRGEIAQVLPTLDGAPGLTQSGRRLATLVADQYRRQAATLRS